MDAMEKDVTAQSLARLQLWAMVGISLLVALVLGLYFFLAQRADFDSTLSAVKARALQEQQNLLTKQIDAIRHDLDYRRSSTESILRREIQQRVDHAYSIADSLYQQNQGRLNPQQIRALIVEALRPLRFFEGRGYYFIDTLDGMCVLLPTAPQLEGTSFWNNRDPTGHYIMRGLVDATRNPAQAGFSRYHWYPPQQKTMQEKIAYVRVFAPLGWVIGAGEYVYNVEQDLQRAALSQLRTLRFGRDGYVSVFDAQFRVLVSPARPDSEGKTVDAFSGLEKRSVETIIAQARRGDGLVRYQWYRPGSTQAVDKLSYVARYAPWGWTLVTGMYLDDLDSVMATERQAMEARTRQRLMIGGVITLGVLTVALLFSWMFSVRMRGLVRRYQARLEQKNHELEDNARRLQLSAAVFESGCEAIMISDADNRIIAVNQPFTRITGYQPEDVIGQAPQLFTSSHPGGDFYAELRQALLSHGQWDGEVWSRRKDGSVFPEWLRVATVKNSTGQIEYHIATFSDISERKNAEEQIRHLAFYDPLTGLPNRRLLLDRLQQALLHSERVGCHAAVLFIDLDNFKSLNDTKGHDVGDLLLIEVASRLKHSVRQTDTVARLGGDEFVVMLEDLPGDFAQAVSDTEKLAQSLIAAIEQPFGLAQYQHHCSCSMGISVFYGQRESVDELLKHADTAMYQAKAAGRNTARFFVPSMQAALEARLQLEAELRHGIFHDQLRLFYQVQIGVDQRASGAEALVRWQHPQRGLVSPGEFIGLAEETGLIVPLGLWVLEQVCQQLARWAASPLTEPLQIAVNVSARQFHQAGFVDDVHQLLQRYQVNPARLKLELTESLLLDNVADSINTMHALRALGIRFSMDDFGTGYSSLTYIKRLPIDQLKIDQSFIRDLAVDHDDEVIVRAIIAMAHSLKLDVIAEGVETEAQRAFLEQHGCHAFQGYLFGRPMPVAQLEALLAQGEQGEPFGKPSP